jgi:hypothetical protein
MPEEVTSAGPLPRPRYNQPAPTPRRVIVRVMQQRCPVCEGVKTVPPDFYTQIGYVTSVARTMCEQCGGKGMIAFTETETVTDAPAPR